MNAILDEALRDQFLPLDCSVDDLLCHPDEAKRFAEKVNRELEQCFEEVEILRRLIGLRKLGEDRGGLRRTKRKYQGRKSIPR